MIPGDTWMYNFIVTGLDKSFTTGVQLMVNIKKKNVIES